MIGKKVKMTKSMAKWYLDNPDCFFIGSTNSYDNSYETVMKMSMACLLGVPIVGTIIKQGSEPNVWGVEFETPLGADYSYKEYKRDIVLVE